METRATLGRFVPAKPKNGPIPQDFEAGEKDASFFERVYGKKVTFFGKVTAENPEMSKIAKTWSEARYVVQLESYGDDPYPESYMVFGDCGGRGLNGLPLVKRLADFHLESRHYTIFNEDGTTRWYDWDDRYNFF